jgi:hypothetical protein
MYRGGAVEQTAAWNSENFNVSGEPTKFVGSPFFWPGVRNGV